jgi:hypothetical protein
VSPCPPRDPARAARSRQPVDRRDHRSTAPPHQFAAPSQEDCLGSSTRSTSFDRGRASIASIVSASAAWRVGGLMGRQGGHSRVFWAGHRCLGDDGHVRQRRPSSRSNRLMSPSRGRCALCRSPSTAPIVRCTRRAPRIRHHAPLLTSGSQPERRCASTRPAPARALASGRVRCEPVVGTSPPGPVGHPACAATLRSGDTCAEVPVVLPFDVARQQQQCAGSSVRRSP